MLLNEKHESYLILQYTLVTAKEKNCMKSELSCSTVSDV